jgi:hypothetical protein
MASICSAVLAGIQKFAPRSRLPIPFVVNWSQVCGDGFGGEAAVEQPLHVGPQLR